MTQMNPDSFRLYEYDGAIFTDRIDTERAEYEIKKRTEIGLKIELKRRHL
jgi:hypothetical protein